MTNISSESLCKSSSSLWDYIQGKKEIEAETGKRLKTKFTSTIPRLEWTLHLMGKKSQKLHDQIDFVVFDLWALRKTQDTTVFRVIDVIQFLEMSGQTNLVLPDY
jgi:hypothetical protein